MFDHYFTVIEMSNKIILYVIILMLSACVTIKPIQEPEVSFSGLSVSSFTFDKQELRLKFDVRNPNDQAIVIKSMEYTVMVADTRLADGEHEQTIRLLANESQTVEIDVTTYLNDVLPLFGQLLTSPGEPLAYTLDLKLRLSSPIPFTHKISQDGKFNFFE